MTTDPEYNMGAEFEALDDETKEAVRCLVNKVRKTGLAESQPFRVGDIYAYPHRDRMIAWGVNGAPHNFCIARDISKPSS